MRENNKLIAEFMGYETYEHTNSIAIRINEDNEFNSLDFGHIHTKFHTSWDWLMPVVFKIIETKSIEAQKRHELITCINSNIQETYDRVINLIIRNHER